MRIVFKCCSSFFVVFDTIKVMEQSNGRRPKDTVVSLTLSARLPDQRHTKLHTCTFCERRGGGLWGDYRIEHHVRRSLCVSSSFSLSLEIAHTTQDPHTCEMNNSNSTTSTSSRTKSGALLGRIRALFFFVIIVNCVYIWWW